MFCFVVVCFVLILSDWILLEGEKTAGKFIFRSKMYQHGRWNNLEVSDATVGKVKPKVDVAMISDRVALHTSSCVC